MFKLDLDVPGKRGSTKVGKHLPGPVLLFRTVQEQEWCQGVAKANREGWRPPKNPQSPQPVPRKIQTTGRDKLIDVRVKNSIPGC